MSGERREIMSALQGKPLTGGREDDLKYSPVAMMPDVKVIKVGGQSIMDRGRTALFPILNELAALKDEMKLLLCCGGGTRARAASCGRRLCSLGSRGRRRRQARQLRGRSNAGAGNCH